MDFSVSSGYIAKNDSSQIFYLALEQRTEPRANVILIPPYGTSVHDSFLLTYYLYANNFNIYRFDPTNHVGMSSGSIKNYKLSQVENDLETVFNFFKARINKPLVLVAPSLSAPVAWKFSSYTPEISSVVSLVGVVDVSDTVEKAGKFSMKPYRDEHLIGEEYQEIFGYNVLAYQFINDIDSKGYGSLQDTIKNISLINTPLYMIVSENDEYVDLKKAKKCFEFCKPNSEFIVIEKASHELAKSMVATKKAASKLTFFCYKASGININEDDIVIPKFTEIISKSSIESNYLNLNQKN
jgi:acyl transferase